MSKPSDNYDPVGSENDLVLREVWRAKDTLSDARHHSVDELFDGLRQREQKSVHRVVNFEKQSGAEAPRKVK